MYLINTDKRRTTLGYICNSDIKINILYGSVRSGKTILSIIAWLVIIKNLSHKAGEIIMVGRTIATLYDNVLSPLKKEYGSFINASRNRPTAIIFGIPVLIRSASDESSEEKIRGLTVVAAYCDEMVLYPNSFIKMLISRLSVDGSKLIGTTNTGNPSHYLYKGIMTNPKVTNKKIYFFNMDDNVDLLEDYKEEMRNSYTGLWYRRFILGEWVSADGAIYDMFDKNVHVVKTNTKSLSGFRFVSIDYGIQNPCTFGLYLKHDDTYYLEKEYYYDGRANKKQKTDSDYTSDLIEWLGGEKIRFVIVDPSATSFIASLKRAKFNVKLAKNAVIEGIQCVSNAFSQTQFFIDKSCKHTIPEYEGYVWDEKSLNRGIEKPLKVNDHCVDRDRYALLTTQNMTKNPFSTLHTLKNNTISLQGII